MRSDPLRTAFLVLAFAGVAGSARAQTAPRNSGDCTGAIPITDSMLVCEHPGIGAGEVLEVQGNAPDDKKWLEREHNTDWYVFQAPVNGPLTFEITPQDADDDFDFLLFQADSQGFCARVLTKQVVPVRSNISRNDKAIASRCGLRADALEDYVHSGVGSSWSKAVNMVQGETWYLLVDAQRPPRGGYTIHLHHAPPAPAASGAASAPQRLRIDVVDAGSGLPVEAAVAVDGLAYDSVLDLQGGSTYELPMETWRKLQVSCLSKGYMLYSTDVAGSGEAEVNVRLALAPIAEGAEVVLKDIHFVGNEATVTKDSRPALLLLLRFLELNPTTRVEIRGHVNGPTYDQNTKEFVRLSTARARSVYDFLLVNDVDPARISYVGLGNAEMLYPDPRNKTESEANRRVEIRVLQR